MRGSLKAAATTYDGARNVAALWMLSFALPAFIVLATAMGERLVGGVALALAVVLVLVLARHVRRRRREGDWAGSDTLAYVVAPGAIALAVGLFLTVVMIRQGGPSPHAAARVPGRAAAATPAPPPGLPGQADPLHNEEPATREVSTGDARIDRTGASAPSIARWTA